MDKLIALDLAAKGMKVFPCNGKKPAIKGGNGFKDASSDPSEVECMWRDFPRAVPGVAAGLSDLIIVDLDVRAVNGSAPKDGKGEWERLLQRVHAIDPAIPLQGLLYVKTPSGGYHAYFRQHPDPALRLGSSIGIGDDVAEGHLSGIDLRGDGGYVIGVGSIMGEGQEYKLITGDLTDIPVIPMVLAKELVRLSKGSAAQGSGKTVTPPPPCKEEITVPPIPFRTTMSEREKAYAQKVLEECCIEMAAAIGGRNEKLNKVSYRIGRIVGGGWLDAKQAASAVWDAAIASGYVEKDGEREARGTMNSGFLKGRADPLDKLLPDDPPSIDFSGAMNLAKQKKSANDYFDGPPEPLPSNLLPVTPFDIEFMPRAFQPWLSDIAHRMGCPIDIVAANMMTAVGSAIGTRYGVRPKAKDDWTVYPNLWGMCVARPSQLKSPAMKEAMAPLQRLEVESRKQYKEARKEYDAESALFDIRKASHQKKLRAELDKNADYVGEELNYKPPVPPIHQRYIVQDSTYEKIGVTMSQNPQGVLVFRDELTGFLLPLDREENAAARGFFLTSWNGDGEYSFERITRDDIVIEKSCVSMFGGTQPAKFIRYAAGSEGDGWAQRVQLLVWPDDEPPKPSVDEEPDFTARQTAHQVFARLINLPDTLSFAGTINTAKFDGCSFCHFDAEAQKIFTSWLDRLIVRTADLDLSTDMQGHLGKYRSLIPSLALINQLVDDEAGPVSAAALNKAIRYSNYLETHAERAYAAASGGDTSGAKTIIARIKKGDLKDGFTLRQIQRANWAGLTTETLRTKAIDMLIEYQWLREVKVQNPKGGPRSTTFQINPNMDTGR